MSMLPLLSALLWNSPLPAQSAPQVAVPVLLYHRFGTTVADSMTIRTSTFEIQLRYLATHGYTVIPLRHLIDYLEGRRASLPPRAVVITVDDGHRSVRQAMLPLVLRYRVPVTLFIYPSAISNAPYALTWQDLKSMKASGWFDIESHTFWHPNFKQEQRRLAPGDYRKLVQYQLVESRRRLQQMVGGDVTLLAWPYGIVDDELMRAATAAGYVAAFTMAAHPASRADPSLALPRYLIGDTCGETQFKRLLEQALRALPAAPAHSPSTRESTLCLV
jgi:peptidoglycan/xylan/chitin deacetylase (PgdA/CDA1 family)